MPQVSQAGNIQKLSVIHANQALDAVEAQVQSGQSLDPQVEQVIIDAMRYHDIHVARRAFSIVGQLPDKQPFVSSLVSYSQDHSRMFLAESAYKAMCRAQDLRPFYQAIEKGVLCPDFSIACAALYSVKIEVGSRKFIAAQLRQAIIDATDHPAGYVVGEALDIIVHSPDKQPFVSVLLKHAPNHAQSRLAIKAYAAMCDARDFSPFYKVIEQGSLSADEYVVRAAILPIARQAEMTGAIDFEFQDSVTNAMDHVNHVAIDCGLNVIKHLLDKRPFIPALQKCANNGLPQLAQTAADLLKDAQNVQPFVQEAPPVIVEAVSNIVLIRNVRLDFNIEANGGGPAVHTKDAMLALCDVFDKSVAGGIVAAKALVFYVPGRKLDEGSVIDVEFPEADREHILSLSAGGVAPEFDLRVEGNGIYTAILREAPSL